VNDITLKQFILYSRVYKFLTLKTMYNLFIFSPTNLRFSFIHPIQMGNVSRSLSSGTWCHVMWNIPIFWMTLLPPSSWQNIKVAGPLKCYLCNKWQGMTSQQTNFQGHHNEHLKSHIVICTTLLGQHATIITEISVFWHYVHLVSTKK